MSAPAGPLRLPSRTWWATIRRTATEFSADNLTDWAAALTYYSVLSLFPALIALVSIVGLFGDPVAVTSFLTDTVNRVSPGATDAIRGPVENLTANRGTAGILFVVGLAVALWAASGYVGAFMRASNIIYEIREGRPFWKLRPLQLLVTLVILVLIALVAVAVVLTGPIVAAVGRSLGLSEPAVTAWSIAKWPVMGLVLLTVIGILYHASPNVRQVSVRWITPGSITALVLWLAASAGFAFYVANFGSYDKTYGTLGGVVVFLVWAWITNVAILFGAELNAELERARELEAGMASASEQIQLPPRDEPR
jgi:membrane protein